MSTDPAPPSTSAPLSSASTTRAHPAPRAICVGLATHDATWTVERLPEGGGKTRAGSYEARGGGMAATAAVTVARLGGVAQFWGRAGDDAAGLAMREELRTFGVDARNLRLFAGARSSVSSVVVDARGERMIVNFRGEDLPSPPDWLPFDAVRDVDVVLADPRWPEAATAVFAHARAARVPTIFDADVSDRTVFDDVLPLVDYAVFSAEAFAAYTGRLTQALELERGLRAVRERGCRIAAVTLGARGVAWYAARSSSSCRHSRSMRSIPMAPAMSSTARLPSRSAHAGICATACVSRARSRRSSACIAARVPACPISTPRCPFSANPRHVPEAARLDVVVGVRSDGRSHKTTQPGGSGMNVRAAVFAAAALLCAAHEAFADETYVLVTGRRDPRMYAISLREALDPRNNNTPNAIVSRAKTALDRLDGKLLGDAANVVISEDRKTASTT